MLNKLEELANKLLGCYKCEGSGYTKDNEICDICEPDYQQLIEYTTPIVILNLIRELKGLKRKVTEQKLGDKNKKGLL